MTILETVIISIVAVLINLKAILLAAATVFFIYGLTAPVRKRKAAKRWSSPGHPRLHLWA